jgi:3-oxoacyl-[acyl-carrier protein] reductase
MTNSGHCVIVMEVWHLKPELADRALPLMQQMDRLLGSSTHSHPGWCGHASFCQQAENPSEIIIVYPWRSRALHADLISREEPLLTEFTDEYCVSRREIHYYTLLDVEVDDPKADSSQVSSKT